MTSPVSENDSVLLDRLAKGDRSALEAIARRHIDLVHAAARRQTRNAHLADDVTQAVFLTLTRKAGSIRKGTHLVGWLYMTTRNIALTARRAATRRDKHEQAARVVPRVEPAEEETILPLLDDAIHELSKSDREAVLLRFFGKLPFADVGDRLGTTEEAARKRVTRAVEKLRERLTARGATASVAAVTTLLAAESAKAAPAATVTGVTGVASASATSLAATAVSVSGPAKLVAGVAAAIAVSGGIAATAVVLAQPATQLSPSSQVVAAPTTLPIPSMPPSVSDAVAAQIMRANEGPPRPNDQPWFAAFKAKYGLAEGEVVKFVPPPFIAERLDFYRWDNPGQAEAIPRGPSFFLLGSTFAGQTSMTFAGRGTGASIDRLLARFCGLRPHEYALPDGTANSPLPEGDWVCDLKAPLEQRLAGFAKVISEVMGVAVVFEKREEESDSVVILSPRASDQEKKLVGMTPEQMEAYNDVKIETDAGPGIGVFNSGGQLDHLLANISKATRWAILDERNAYDQLHETRFVTFKHTGSPDGAIAERRVDQADVEALMKVVAERIGFEFKIDKRKYTVWAMTVK